MRRNRIERKRNPLKRRSAEKRGNSIAKKREGTALRGREVSGRASERLRVALTCKEKQRKREAKNSGGDAKIGSDRRRKRWDSQRPAAEARRQDAKGGEMELIGTESN